MKIFATVALVLTALTAHAYVVEDLKAAILSSDPEVCRSLLPSSRLTKNKCDSLIAIADSIIEKRRTECFQQGIISHLSLKQITMLIGGWINLGISKKILMKWLALQLSTRQLNNSSWWFNILALPFTAIVAASGIYFLVTASSAIINTPQSEALYLNSIEIKYILQSYRITIKE